MKRKLVGIVAITMVVAINDVTVADDPSETYRSLMERGAKECLDSPYYNTDDLDKIARYCLLVSEEQDCLQYCINEALGMQKNEHWNKTLTTSLLLPLLKEFYTPDTKDKDIQLDIKYCIEKWANYWVQQYNVSLEKYSYPEIFLFTSGTYLRPAMKSKAKKSYRPLKFGEVSIISDPYVKKHDSKGSRQHQPESTMRQKSTRYSDPGGKDSTASAPKDTRDSKPIDFFQMLFGSGSKSKSEPRKSGESQRERKGSGVSQSKQRDSESPSVRKSSTPSRLRLSLTKTSRSRLPSNKSSESLISRPSVTRPSGARTSGDRASGMRTSGDRASGMRPSGDRTSGMRPSGDRTSGMRTPGDKASEMRPPGDRATGMTTPGDRASGMRTPGDRASGMTTPEDKASGIRTPEDKASGMRTPADKSSTMRTSRVPRSKTSDSRSSRQRLSDTRRDSRTSRTRRSDASRSTRTSGMRQSETNRDSRTSEQRHSSVRHSSVGKKGTKRPTVEKYTIGRAQMDPLYISQQLRPEIKELTKALPWLGKFAPTQSDWGLDHRDVPWRLGKPFCCVNECPAPCFVGPPLLANGKTTGIGKRWLKPHLLKKPPYYDICTCVCPGKCTRICCERTPRITRRWRKQKPVTTWQLSGVEHLRPPIPLPPPKLSQVCPPDAGVCGANEPPPRSPGPITDMFTCRQRQPRKPVVSPPSPEIDKSLKGLLWTPSTAALRVRDAPASSPLWIRQPYINVVGAVADAGWQKDTADIATDSAIHKILGEVVLEGNENRERAMPCAPCERPKKPLRGAQQIWRDIQERYSPGFCCGVSDESLQSILSTESPRRTRVSEDRGKSLYSSSKTVTADWVRSKMFGNLFS